MKGIPVEVCGKCIVNSFMSSNKVNVSKGNKSNDDMAKSSIKVYYNKDI